MANKNINKYGVAVGAIVVIASACVYFYFAKAKNTETAVLENKVVPQQTQQAQAPVPAATVAKEEKKSEKRDVAAISKSLEKDLPDNEIRAELEGQGYHDIFIDELLKLKKSMKEAGISPDKIRQATLGGPDARNEFSRNLPQGVQAQLVKTIQAMIAPSAGDAEKKVRAAEANGTAPAQSGK